MAANNIGGKLWGIAFGVGCMVLAVGCTPPEVVPISVSCAGASQLSRGPLGSNSALSSSTLSARFAAASPAPGSPDAKNPAKMFGALAQAIEADSRARGTSAVERLRQLQVTIVLAGDEHPRLAASPMYQQLVDSVKQIQGVAQEAQETRLLLANARHLIDARKHSLKGSFVMSASDTVASVAAVLAAADYAADTTATASAAISNSDTAFVSAKSTFVPDTQAIHAMNGVVAATDSARVLYEWAMWAAYAQGYSPEWSVGGACSTDGFIPFGGTQAYSQACVWCWSGVRSLATGVATGGIVAWVRHGIGAVHDAVVDGAIAGVVSVGLENARAITGSAINFAAEQYNNIIEAMVTAGIVPRIAQYRPVTAGF